ncbi:MAG: tryptophan 7-halogenase [Alphaproteobacteria bacterium]|nr:tryptophan 7-halogenase [Alphaproteobacteria bacterium]
MIPATDHDLAVIGAGPTGAALAQTLAPRHRVLLVDRAATPERRIGESLIPAARRLLRDMAILDAHEALVHPAYLGNRSYWGDGPAQTTDFLRDPDRPGWHLDRARFEAFLRSAAIQRGATVMAPARLTGLTRIADKWELELTSNDGESLARASLIVDATGRAASIGKRLGADRQNTDRLAAHWITGSTTGGPERAEAGMPGFSVVESEPAGWWYTAPLAEGGRVLAFHTEPDINPLAPREADALVNRALALPGIGPMLRETGFSPETALSVTAANSARLAETAGDGWIAIGDAALSFDPIASRGLFNALYTAWSGAMACHDVLTGARDGFADYTNDLENVWALYQRHLAVVYGSEPRWRDQPFWARRAVAG